VTAFQDGWRDASRMELEFVPGQVEGPGQDGSAPQGAGDHQGGKRAPQRMNSEGVQGCPQKCRGCSPARKEGSLVDAGLKGRSLAEGGAHE